MTQDEILQTFKRAIKYGGSFDKKLGECGLVADSTNRALIFLTWPQMVSQYGPDSDHALKK